MNSFELTGSAINGIIISQSHLRMIHGLPTTVKLGRRIGSGVSKVPQLQLDKYFDPKRVSVPYPASTNRRTKAAIALARMYLNDAYGDCIPAMIGHWFGVLSANDSDASSVIMPTDQEVLDFYHSACGAGDPGCIMREALFSVVNGQFKVAGKSYVINAPLYCLYQGRSDLVRAAIYCFGAAFLGFHVPPGWMASNVWDSSNWSANSNGHAVAVIDYDQGGVYVASWGRIYYMTWAGFDSLPAGFETEFMVAVSNAWTNADGINSSTGIDMAGLLADQQLIAQQSIVPDIVNPNPSYTGSVVMTGVQTVLQVLTVDMAVGIAEGYFVKGDGTMYSGTFQVKDSSGAVLYLTVVDGLAVSVSPNPSPPPPPPTASWKFDFGTAGSPVASGYTKVTESTMYSASQAYGFVDSGSVRASADRAIGSDLLRDFVYGSDLMFQVDIPNGNYTVGVSLGDMGPYSHDQQAVSLNGTQVDMVSTVVGQVVQKSYKVAVTTGQIVLHLKDMGGSDPNVVIEAMTIDPI